jgi:hypothetical protein
MEMSPIAQWMYQKKKKKKTTKKKTTKYYDNNDAFFIKNKCQIWSILNENEKDKWNKETHPNTVQLKILDRCKICNLVIWCWFFIS